MSAKTKFKPNRKIAGETLTNGQRADAAAAAIDGHNAHLGQSPDEANLRDLLADLMHLCQRQGMDWEHALQMATDRYNEEK